MTRCPKCGTLYDPRAMHAPLTWHVMACPTCRVRLREVIVVRRLTISSPAS